MTHQEMLEGISVIIPARANSSRVPEKNFKPFHGDDSLLDIKIKQLITAGIPPEHIVVSCEDVSKEPCVTLHGATFKRREHFLTTPEGEKDIFRCMMNIAPVFGMADDVLVVSVTDPAPSNVVL